MKKRKFRAVRRQNAGVYRLLNGITFLVTSVIIIPFIWILVMSFKTDTEILTEPFAFPEQLRLDNFRRALDILPLGSMYPNTFIIAFFTEII